MTAPKLCLEDVYDPNIETLVLGTDTPEARFAEVMGAMLTTKSLEDTGAGDEAVDTEIEKLDAMMQTWWPGILEEIGIDKIRDSLSWLG